MNESARTAIVVNELQSIRNNKIDLLLQAKEMELDSAVLSYSLYEERNPSWITYPFNKIMGSTV